jgi:hypothetical protein
LRDPPDHSYPDILKNVSSRLVVAHESPNERPEWRMPASDQILERGRFTQLAPYGQNPPASTSHVGFRCIVPGRRNGNDRTLRASFASGRFALRRDDSITTTGGPCR